MKKIIFLLTIFSFGFSSVVWSQKITLSGTTFGYISEKMLIIKKAQKNVSFEGTLDKVTITVTGKDYNKTIHTDAGGNFTISLDNPGSYSLNIEAKGYSTLKMEINYVDAGNKSHFGSLFILLKKEDDSAFNIGQLSIDKEGEMSFNENTSISEKSKTDVFHSNVNLFKKSSLINNAFTSYPKQTSPTTTVKSDKIKQTVSPLVQPIVIDTIRLEDRNPILLALSDDPDSLKFQLENAREMLSDLDTSSVEYKVLMQQILLAEQQIIDKELIIDLQGKELSSARKVILFISLSAGVSLLFVGFLLYFLKQRKVHALRLKEKNKKISKINADLLSSIRYAALIQSKFLQDAVNITKLYPDSFIYNRPKDLISGDFYWFSKKNGHSVIVLGDCTGHGVPGGLLTILGHSTLEEIVNVQGEISPDKIILGLNKAVIQTFSKSEGELEYGMDVTVLSIKEGSTTVTMSGVVNGVYVKTQEGMQHYYVTGTPLGPELNEEKLKNQSIPLKQGDCLYMFSDGYHDQFNGRTDKIEKFNVVRFESLLKNLGEEKNFQKAGEKLDKVLAEWKGNRNQTDDILILGIRL